MDCFSHGMITEENNNRVIISQLDLVSMSGPQKHLTTLYSNNWFKVDNE